MFLVNSISFPQPLGRKVWRNRVMIVWKRRKMKINKVWLHGGWGQNINSFHMSVLRLILDESIFFVKLNISFIAMIGVYLLIFLQNLMKQHSFQHSYLIVNIRHWNTEIWHIMPMSSIFKKNNKLKKKNLSYSTCKECYPMSQWG